MKLIKFVIWDSCYGSTTKSLVLYTVLLLANANVSFALSADDVNLILNTHNNYRRRFAMGIFGVHVADMRQLKWSQSLQLQAEESLDCSYATVHHEIDPYDIGYNFGSVRSGGLSSIIMKWIREGRYFSPDEGACMYLHECRAFMALINAEHHSIGCAYKRCHDGSHRNKSLLCIYSGGNYIIPAYKTGAACTKCKGATSFCNHGLCTSCNSVDGQGCDCRKSCHKQGIGEGRLDNSTCTCQCRYGLGPNCDEDCVNPRSYIDFDICEFVHEDECTMGGPEERAALAEFCPATCTCRRHPEAELIADSYARETMITTTEGQK